MTWRSITYPGSLKISRTICPCWRPAAASPSDSLYTNAEEQIFQAQRPIILNGISAVVTRGDLLDRAIVVTLPPIPEENRKDEATFWQEYEIARPGILGTLLDAVSVGLRRVGDVHLERKPRMADFAVWGVAAEPACPWPEGMFLRAYTGNRQGAIEATSRVIRWWMSFGRL